MKTCPFCQSDSFISISPVLQTSFKCEKTETTGTQYYSSTRHSDWRIDIYTEKRICTSCGMVHEQITEKSLTDYNRDKDYIVKR